MKRKTKIFIIASSILVFLAILAIGVVYYILISVYNLDKALIIAGIKNKFYAEDDYEKYYTANQKYLDITNYNIFLEINNSEKTISGEVVIKGKILSKTLSQIDLNFYDNMQVTELKIDGMKSTFEHSKALLSITPEKALKDSFTVKIKYFGEPLQLGFSSFNFEKFQNKPVVYTLNEPIYASTWLPCNDMPDDKALVEIRIKNDSSMVSVSNGINEKVVVEGAKKTYFWKTFYPISTYLIAVYSGNYKHYSQEYISSNKDTMDIDYYVFPEHLENAKVDFFQHPKMIKIFAGLFGEYPFIKEKYGVAEFLWQQGAMEHQTITGIASDMVSGMGFHKDILIHELAHHWWGNAVGPKSWKDLWLNEGFATYSEALFYEKESGYKSLQSTMSAKKYGNDSQTLYNPEGSLFSENIYNKGAWVLHMLRNEIGDSSFFKLLKTYYQQYKYKNASTADFIKLSEQVSGKNLKTFFEQWVFSGKGMIELEYHFSVQKVKDEYEISLNIQQVQDGYDTYQFQMEVLINGAEQSLQNVRINNKNSVYKLKSRFFPKEIVLDPNEKLYCKVNKK